MEHEVASFVVRCAKIRVGLNLMRLADMVAGVHVENLGEIWGDAARVW